MKFLVRAPSNIALIKYMGKRTEPEFLGRNIPENPSLSMTLDSLSTYLEIETVEDGRDRFRLDPSLPDVSSDLLRGARFFPVELKPQGIAKFEKHYRRVQAKMGNRKASVIVKSANTFPAGSGIASSASSFAALTLGAFLANAPDSAAAVALFRNGNVLRGELARISREGSGSSCRSFEGPWVQWENEETSPVFSGMPEMAHFVIVVSSGEKAVSSTDAHARVKTSPLWEGRPARANERFLALRQALQSGDRAQVARLAWSEMWEMHSLFHTAEEPFSYWNPGTIDALHYFGGFLRESSPPIVTLDAGPNVHMIVPRTEGESWRARLVAKFGAGVLLEDRQGVGAEIL